MGKAILDRAEFRAWLEANKRKVVGVTWQDCDCPIARYLHKQGYQRVNVSDSGWYLIDGRQRQLPNWAARFVSDIDFKIGGNKRLRGAQALAVLDSIN